ncbi:hypothetical protein K2X33_14600 [bacterium]|nr:hypothetical protein [bacterium]
MRRILVLSTVLLSFASTNYADDKPYDKALVLAGGGHQTASFLGMVEYGMEHGWTPDVIISTCGSSVANQIMNISKDPKEWRRIIESREFHEMLLREKVNPDLGEGTGALGLVAKNALATLGREVKDRPQVEFKTDLFGPGLLEIPVEGPPKIFDVPFSADKGIRSVMVAARVDYSPDEVGQRRNGAKTLTETYWTDPDTGKHLVGFRSPMAQMFPDSVVNPDTAVITDQTLSTASRASISEPTLMNAPYIIQNGKKVYFSAGSIDSYPIEVGQHLAKHVVATRVGYIDDIATMVGENVHGFNMNDRRVKANQLQVDHWIDRTGNPQIDDLEQKIGFTLSGGKLLNLTSGIPEDYEEYKRIVKKHWDYGRREMADALKYKGADRPFQKESLAGRKQGVFHQAGMAIRHVFAPIAAADALKDEWEEEEELAGALSSVSHSHGVGLISYALATAALEAVRRYGMETTPERMAPPLEAAERLVLDLRKKPGQPEAGVKTLHAKDLASLQKLLENEPAKYAMIDIIADTKGGVAVFSDGKAIPSTGLPRLGKEGATVRFLVSKLARSKAGRDQAYNTSQALAPAAKEVLTARTVVFPENRSGYRTVFGMATGLRNISTAFRAAVNTPAAVASGMRALAPHCDAALASMIR